MTINIGRIQDCKLKNNKKIGVFFNKDQMTENPIKRGATIQLISTRVILTKTIEKVGFQSI